MAFEFLFPDVGEGIAEGELIKWLVKVGDTVKEDQTLVQIETDKAVVDLPSPKNGTILKLHYKEGDTIKVGSVLVTIGGKNDKISENNSPKEDKKEEQEVKRGRSVVGELEEAPDEEEITPKKQTVQKNMAPTQKVLASPLVRKKADELKIDLTTVKGTGDQGQILLKDLDSGLKNNSKTKETLPLTRSYSNENGYEEIIELKGVRKTIAQNMVRSLSETAQLTAMEDIIINNLMTIKETENKELAKESIKLTLLPFIVEAVVATLKEYPLFNAVLKGEQIIQKKYYHIGIAVETPVGLMVPVLRNADQKTIKEISLEIKTLAEGAKNRTIKIEDLKGSTFTITNYGSIGGTYATPVINLGESAILGIGRVFDRLVLDSKNQIINHKILPISLTFDHQIIDGGEAARFINTLKSYLENPDHLLLELK